LLDDGFRLTRLGWLACKEWSPKEGEQGKVFSKSYFCTPWC